MTDDFESPAALPYSTQWLDDADFDAVRAVLEGAWLTTGPAVEAFEAMLAETAGARHAVVVSSGTAALHAGYAAAGIGPGDEIVTSPLTFVATASTAIFCGAAARFADIDERTGNLSPAAAEAALTDRTRMIVTVDFAGHPADYDAFGPLARDRGIALHADAAHSLGAAWRGRPAGSLADASTFSFHPVKSITSGEGGAVVTNDGDLAGRARAFRNHGIERDPAKLGRAGADWYYEVRSLGLNYRLPDILCALGSSQLGKLGRFIDRRRRIAASYLDALAGEPGLELPVELDGASSSWHLFVVRVREAARRDALYAYLRANGVLAQVHYMPVYLHPAYAELGYAAGQCPVAEDFASRALSIPLFPKMSDADAERVVETVRAGCRAVL